MLPVLWGLYGAAISKAVAKYGGSCVSGAAFGAILASEAGPVGILAGAAGGCTVGVITKGLKSKGGNWKAVGTTIEYVGYVGNSERAAVISLRKIFGKEAIGRPVYVANLGARAVVVVAKVTYRAVKQVVAKVPKPR